MVSSSKECNARTLATPRNLWELVQLAEFRVHHSLTVVARKPLLSRARQSQGREKIGIPFTNRHCGPAARSLRSRLSQWPIAQITDSEPRPQGAGRCAEQSRLRFFHRSVSLRSQRQQA